MGEKLSLASDVETWKPFLINSDSLPIGTPITTWVIIRYRGNLRAIEYVEDAYCSARASGELTLYNDYGDVLAYRKGTAEVECELIDGEYDAMVETSGAWNGKLHSLSDEYPIYSLNYEEAIVFTAYIGSRYWLYFDLATSVSSSAVSGDNLDWSDVPTLVTADFYNTGEYELGCADPSVYFVMVPEPTVMTMLVSLALMFGAFFGLRRFRRA